MGFLLKNFNYSVVVVAAFYTMLILGDGLGVKQAAESSFDLLTVIITFINFSFSVANIRIK